MWSGVVMQASRRRFWPPFCHARNAATADTAPTGASGDTDQQWADRRAAAAILKAPILKRPLERGV